MEKELASVKEELQYITAALKSVGISEAERIALRQAQVAFLREKDKLESKLDAIEANGHTPHPLGKYVF